MGEVYQAKDTKLGRDVAIKVLPEEFARDADRVARFQREAKLLASLNHPNIAAIYGLEESDGTNFLVMELVEGQTLDDQIKSGPIPVEESLKLALQIAEALEAAHEKGVIHRDLKPANIKVTPDGKVKVLDFGLAKAFAGEQAEMDLSQSPTLSQAATQQGIILGTAAYMSPEQARGKEVDKRADVWAFGVVLFEMLTGQSLFSGEDVSSTLARVLEREPAFSTLPPNIHPQIRFLLERCLKKDPKNRYSGINDARVDIQEVLADPSGVFVQPIATEEPQRKLRIILPWVAAAIVVAGIAVWILKPSPPPEPKKVIHYDYNLPEDQQFGRNPFGAPANIAVSPDGSHFVYCTPDGLYLRSVDQWDAILINGTNGDSARPFFSPDGNWLGYWDAGENKLKKVSISRGTPVSLCDDVPFLLGASWNEDDTIIYGAYGQGIMRVSKNGGTPKTLIESEGALLIGPQILPDGKSVLYTRGQFNVNVAMISMHSLESGETKELFPGINPRYLPTGHLVYELDNNLLAVPFDPNAGEETGDTVLIEEGVGPYSISNEGTLVFIPWTTGTARPESILVWKDREGKEEPLALPPDIYNNVSISPDGTRLALEIGSADEDIWIWDLDLETISQLTFDESRNVRPIWTPDSNRIIFCSDREGTPSIFRKPADGAGVAESLAEMPDEFIAPFSITSDGKTLFFLNQNMTGYNIGMLSMEGDDDTPKLLLQEEYEERNPMISPDGRWLAYESDEDGQYDIYVRSFPEVDKGQWRISTNGGDNPFWSPDGRELFFENPEGIMSVPVETETAFKRGNPELLFSAPYYDLLDIHPENKRFLMEKPVAMTEEESSGGFPRKINIILNWFEELKQKVPVP